MSTKAFFLKTLFFFLSRILSKQLISKPKGLQRNGSNVQCKYKKYPSLVYRSDLLDHTLVFNLEGTLLRSTSLFPYFMLVAFEAGGLLRAFVLFALYPFVCLVCEEVGLNVMVMVCFLGIKKDSFRVGSGVLPKFFLEDVGLESFEVLKRGRKRVCVSDMPQVMIESFLRDYLEIEVVFGRELKVFRGYFTGFMEEKKKDMLALEKTLEEEKMSCDVIGISGFKKSLNQQLYSHCKEVYLASKEDRRYSHQLPRDQYPKPLIFHDGRLALRPMPVVTLAMFMWAPFGFILAITRIVISLSLPYNMSTPLLAFSGLRLIVTKPKSSHSPPNAKESKTKGLLYVCNHRTLLDPLYLSFALKKKNLTAVTYSLSRMSELLAPIRTVRLTRNRDQDAKMMEMLLKQGDLVVCPEGTTCREPYLLRFSPLFSEMSEDIVPVAVDTKVGIFYGTTASGLKCLDPLFFLMNPGPTYTIQLLDIVSGSSRSYDGEKSRIVVANQVQRELGEALGFECTKLTRRDKYLILAGNEGITCPSKKP